MRIAVFVLALLGALACGGLGWKYKSDERNSEEARQIRQIDRELARGDDPFLRAMRDELNDHYRWIVWLCYALLAALPLGMLGGLLALHRKGWLAGLVLLLAAAGPLVCAWQLSSLARDPWVMAVPTGPLALAGLLSFFVRARPAARRQEKPAAAPPAPVAAAPSDLLSAACPTCASTLKYAPMPRPRSIRCPRCKTVISVPGAQPVEVTQMVEPEPEVAPPEPRKRPRQRSTSPVATILGWVLAVGGTTAFSVLAALDIIALVPAQPDQDRPLARMRGPGDGGQPDLWGGGRPRQEVEEALFNAPPDPEPDAQEEARFAEERTKQLRQHQAREKPFIEPLRQLPAPKLGEYDEPALLALATFGVPKASFDQVLFAPDGETVAAAGEKTIRLWDLRTGKERHTLQGGDKGISQIAFSPDGQVLAAAELGTVRLWDARTGAVRHVLKGRFGGYLPPNLAFHRDGRLLTGGGVSDRGGNAILVWDVATGQPTGDLAPQRNVTAHLTVSPRQSHLAHASDFARQVVLADAQSGEARRAIQASLTKALAFSPDGKTLAVAAERNNKQTVTLYEVRTGKLLHTLDVASKPQAPLAFSPDGKTLATRSGDGYDGTFTLWDADTGKARQTIKKGHFHSVAGLAFSPGGTFLVTAGGSQVSVWAVEELFEGRDAALLETVRTFASLRRVGTGLRAEPNKEFGDEELARLKAVPRLTGIRLNFYSTVTDAGVAHLAGLNDLEELVLASKKPITDASLAHLKDLKRLTVLGVGEHEGVTDTGLAHLSGLTALKELNLASTKVTSAGLVHLKGMTALERLDLRYLEGVTDDGLAHLEGMKGMTELRLGGTHTGDAGLARLKGMTGMRTLHLNGRDVTDAGLAHLKGMTRLEELRLGGAVKVTDAGLAHLKDMTALKTLELVGSGEVTDAGLAHLAGMTRLVELHFGDLENIKGTGLKHLKGMKDMRDLYLPQKVTDEGLVGIKDLTQLEALTLGEDITDAGFVHLAALTKLKRLRIYHLAGLKGPGLRHLKKMEGLTDLDLNKSGLTDDGLSALKELPQVRTLWLPPQIGDAGVAHLAGLTGLTSLNLSQTKVTDAGVAHLKGLTALTWINLGGTKITDAALDHLAGLKKLTYVNLSETGVTKEAIAKLKKALPEIRIGTE